MSDATPNTPALIDGAGTALRAREDFAGQELELAGETASNAVAAQARAAVEARAIMAIRRPRDIDQVRHNLLRECRRSGFAEAARYHKPVGAGIEGPSIRFAEAALRAMTNVLIESPVVFENKERRTLRVTVQDLEANATYTKDVSVQKVVERRNLRQGQTALSKRTNSTGQTVFLVEATDDDLLNKEGALVSKAIRTLGLRLIPGDLVDEAMDLVQETLKAAAKKDPNAERNKVTDAFSRLNITPEDLKTYLGHPVGQASPVQLARLREIWATINEGATTWADIMEHKAAQPAAQPAATATATAERTAAQTAARKEEMKKAAQKKKAGAGKKTAGKKAPEAEGAAAPAAGVEGVTDDGDPRNDAPAAAAAAAEDAGGGDEDLFS